MDGVEVMAHDDAYVVQQVWVVGEELHEGVGDVRARRFDLDDQLRLGPQGGVHQRTNLSARAQMRRRPGQTVSGGFI